MYCPRVPTARTVKVSSLICCRNSHRCHRNFCVMVTEGSTTNPIYWEVFWAKHCTTAMLAIRNALLQSCKNKPKDLLTNGRSTWPWQICSSLAGQPSTLASISSHGHICHCKLVTSNLSVVHLFSRCTLFVWEGFLLVEEHGLCQWQNDKHGKW